MTPQQQRIEQSDQTQRRRTELAVQIDVGEQSLLASTDNRTRRALDQRLTQLRNELQNLDSLPVNGVHEPFAEFKERMGCECVRTHGGNLLFENGGISDGRSGHIEPPTDATALLHFRIEFLEHKFEDSQLRADKIQNYIVEQSKWFEMGAGPPAEEAAFEQLNKNKADTERLKQEIAAARGELRKLTGPSQFEHFVQQASERQRAADAARQRALNV